MLGPLEDLLQRDAGAPRRADDRETLAVIHRNGLRLLKLVNTLLDFSRIEAGRHEAPVRADRPGRAHRGPGQRLPLGDRAGRAARSTCAARRPEPVYVDRDMWEKIVLNLLSNAFKFTFEGAIARRARRPRRVGRAGRPRHGHRHPAGRARPRLRALPPRGARAPARTRARASASRWSRSSCGCTAATCASRASPAGAARSRCRCPAGAAHLPADRIAAGLAARPAAVGGRPSSRRRWAGCPTPRRPATARRRGRARARRRPAASGRRVRILVADDNADMREYVARLLAPALGRRGRRRRRGGAGRAPRAPGRPRADRRHDARPRRLRRCSGPLRADPATRDIPVILLSARAGEESRVEGLEAGADDYLIKPFSARELVARVRRTSS